MCDHLDIEQHQREDEAAYVSLDLLMRHDPDIAEVVAAMRSQGRTWRRIANCFRRQIVDANAVNNRLDRPFPIKAAR